MSLQDLLDVVPSGSEELSLLRSIDFEFSPRIQQFRSDVEEALGDAFSEPAADVRGFVESVKSPA